MTLSKDLAERLWKKGLRLETEKWWTNATYIEHIGWEASTRKIEYVDDGKSGKRPVLVKDKQITEFHIENICPVECRYGKAEEDVIYYPTPNSDELLGVMPQFYGCFHNRADEWVATPWHLDPDKHPDPIHNKSLPEALGLMAEWLLDNGYQYNEVKKCLERKE